METNRNSNEKENQDKIWHGWVKGPFWEKKQESNKKEQEWERKTGAREKKRSLGVENNRQNKYLQRRCYQLCTIVFQCNTSIDKVLQ